MIWKLCCLTLMLIVLPGCDTDTLQPKDPSEDPAQYTIRDLRLSVRVSDDTIARGDTLHIYMGVWNPKRGPIDVGFPDTCQEGFWVYDDQGQDVTPPYGCFDMPTWLHFEPRERRTYHLKWRTCYGIKPGQFHVVAGFHPLVNDTAYTADPIAVQVLGRHEDVTGTWTGSCFDFWGIPGWAGNRISLALVQRNTTVTGTLRAGGPDFEIDTGSIRDTELVLKIRLESDDLEIEFTGDVCGDGIEGWRRLRRVSTGQLLDIQYWHVVRVN